MKRPSAPFDPLLPSGAPSGVASTTDLPRWREQLLGGLLTVAFWLGLLVAVPSAVVAWREGLWLLATTDFLLLLLIAVLRHRLDWPYRVRAAATLGGLYTLGVVLLYSIGPLSQIYLLTVPVLCAVLLGRTATVLALAGCTASLFLVGYFGQVDTGSTRLAVPPLLHWLTLAINFLLVATLLSLACGFLLRSFEAQLQALRASDTRHSAIFEIVPEALALWRREDNRLLEVNRGFEALSGWSRTEALGRTERELQLLTDDTWERLQTALQSGQAQVRGIDGRLRRRDGELRQVILSTTAFELDGEACALTVAEDVTDERERERALRESTATAQAATLANQMKDEFLAMISHEVRTPLGGMMGMLRSALRDGGLLPQTRSKLDLSLHHAGVLLNLINDILDYSKLEAGRLVLEDIDTDVVALLHNATDLLAERAEAKGLSLEVEIAPDLRPWWRCDPTRLRQLVINLVGNAIKFTERGGVKVRLAPTGTGVQLDVSDTGIGIAPEHQQRLFQRFEQADASTSRQYGGTGLGLAICQHIVDAMGGRIDVRSAPGEGTTFTVALPLAAGQPASDTSMLPLTAHPVSLAVLCAEDSHTNQIILRELLEDMGHTVTLVDDGSAALAELVARDHDLVILDSRMPGMDGLTALTRLRANVDGVRDSQIPVLALTANAGAEERARFLAAGADDFLTKPVDERALHQAVAAQIARLLARQRPLHGERHRAAQGSPALMELDALFGLAPAPEPVPWQASPAIVSAFRREAPRLQQGLHQALLARDAGAVALAAHTLKGNAGYVSAHELGALCAEIETLADQGRLDAIAPLLPTLDERLTKALAHPTQEPTP